MWWEVRQQWSWWSASLVKSSSNWSRSGQSWLEIMISGTVHILYIISLGSLGPLPGHGIISFRLWYVQYDTVSNHWHHHRSGFRGKARSSPTSSHWEPQHHQYLVLEIEWKGDRFGKLLTSLSRTSCLSDQLNHLEQNLYLEHHVLLRLRTTTRPG